MRNVIEYDLSYFDPKTKELKQTVFKIEVIPRIVVKEYFSVGVFKKARGQN